MKLEFWVPGITIGASKPQMCTTHIKRKEKSEIIKLYTKSMSIKH